MALINVINNNGISIFFLPVEEYVTAGSVIPNNLFSSSGLFSYKATNSLCQLFLAAVISGYFPSPQKVPLKYMSHIHHNVTHI